MFNDMLSFKKSKAALIAAFFVIRYCQMSKKVWMGFEFKVWKDYGRLYYD